MATIKFKRGVVVSIPTLAAGEPGWATDTQNFYMGTGSGNIRMAKNSELHAQNHETRHRSGGGDPLNHDNLAGFLAAEHKSLPNTIAQVLSDHNKAAHDALGLSHDSLVDVSIDDHHAKVHGIVGSAHFAAGLTTGHVIRASGSSTFVFAQLQHGDLGGVTINQHHPKFHASQHHSGGGDLVNHDSLTGFVAAEHRSLPAPIAQVISDHTKAVHDALLITILGSGALAKDHGSASIDMLVNVCYGAGSPPTANTTTIGTIWLKYV